MTARKTAASVALDLIEFGIPIRAAAEHCGITPQSIDATIRSTRACKLCSGPIPRHRLVTAIYCSEDCSRRSQAGRPPPRPAVRKCRRCRAAIDPKRPPHTKYCGPDCYTSAHDNNAATLHLREDTYLAILSAANRRGISMRALVEWALEGALP